MVKKKLPAIKKMNDKEKFKYDFAISYAGEEEEIAKGIHDAIKEKYANYSVFFAPNELHNLIGQNGEEFFEKLFSESKQVIVILSENYKKKDWTRYEWDIIRERNKENRCIPIKIDNVRILGFPSNQIYLPFKENFQAISKLSIEKLILFEKTQGIERETEVVKLYNELKDSKGALDKAVQLVYDSRERTPLGKIEYPIDNFTKSYKIIKTEYLNFSQIKRKAISIDLKDFLSKDEVKFNIKYLTAEFFNSEQLDAIKIFIYCSESKNFQGFEKYNVAKSDFAPYGEWGKSEEGFAYNLPTEKFDWKIEFEESYFDKNIKMETAEEMAMRLIIELNKKSR